MYCIINETGSVSPENIKYLIGRPFLLLIQIPIILL